MQLLTRKSLYAAEALRNHSEELLYICAVLYKTMPPHMGYMVLEPRKVARLRMQ